MTIVNCDRCNGKGSISCFKHVEAGICFKCDGSGKMEESAASPENEVAPLFFSHTLTEQNNLHIFQRDMHGNCKYWVNTVSQGVYDSNSHIDLTIEELRTKYREVRNSIRASELLGTIHSAEFALEQGAYNNEEHRDLIITVLRDERAEYTALTGEEL